MTGFFENRKNYYISYYFSLIIRKNISVYKFVLIKDKLSNQFE